MITDRRNIFLWYWTLTRYIRYTEWGHKAFLAPRLNKTTSRSYRTQAEIVSRQTWFSFLPQNPGKSIGENRLVEVVGIPGASVTRPAGSSRTNWRRTILTPAQISPAPICYERKRMSKENELTVTYKSRHRRFRD